MPMEIHRFEELKRSCAHIDVTADGIVVKKVSAATIQDSWRPAIEAVRDLCIERCRDRLDSVYVLGSAARGCARDGISDLDIIALTTVDLTPDLARWTRDVGQSIETKFPYVSRLELAAGPVECIDFKYGLRWLLKLHSVCLYGPDRALDIPDYRMGPDIARYRFHIQSDLCKALAGLTREPDASARIIKCQWIMKRILRTGFELVMQQVGTLTSDSEPCYEFFSAFYPDRSPQMRRVLELALRPTDRLDVVIPVVCSFVHWLPAEVSRVFGEAQMSSTVDDGIGQDGASSLWSSLH